MTVSEAQPGNTYLARIGACIYFAHLRRGRWFSTTCGKTTSLDTPDEITLCK